MNINPPKLMIGALVGMAFVQLTELLYPPLPTEKERIANLVRQMQPKPVAMHIDPAMINIFLDLAHYRKHHEKAFLRCQQQADRVCKLAKEVDAHEREATRAVSEAMERYEESSLKALAILYRHVRDVVDADAITERERHRKWQAAQRANAVPAGKPGGVNRRRDLQSAKAGDPDSGALVRDKLPHEVIYMFYGKLHHRLGTHVNHILAMRRAQMLHKKAPVPSSSDGERRSQPAKRAAHAASDVNAVD